MIDKIVCGAVLAAVGAVSHAATAAPAEWEFTWKGFSVVENGSTHYDPEMTITGRFAGLDGNQDGILSLGEVTSLTFGQDTLNYAACTRNSPTFQCHLWSFSYSAAGGLDFVAEQTRNSAPPGTTHDLTVDTLGYDTDHGMVQRHYGYMVPLVEYSLLFTNDTVRTVTQISPVPEPGTYALLGAGLLVLAAAHRTRQRK